MYKYDFKYLINVRKLQIKSINLVYQTWIY